MVPNPISSHGRIWYECHNILIYQIAASISSRAPASDSRFMDEHIQEYVSPAPDLLS